MRTTVRLSLAGAVAGAFCLVAAPAALAQEAPAVCGYPFDCPEVIGGDTTDEATGDQPVVDRPAAEQPAAEQPTADAGAGGVTIVGGDTSAATASPTTVSSGAVLPFTGGETLLVGVAGIGLLMGGTAFVVAGRRRVASV